MHYEQLLRRIYHFGERRQNRTSVDTRSVFGATLAYDLRRTWPLITTKRVFWRGVVVELLWFLRGETSLDYLHEHNVHIWDEWADEDGQLGPVYGYQWRNFGGDQIAQLVDGLRDDPYSRRHILSAWNAEQLDDMALPPCHMFAQFYADRNAELHAQVYQRSADMFLGVPFNIASYALLTYLLAAQTGLKPGSLRLVLGDAHIYENHMEQVHTQLAREPYPFPTLSIAPRDSIFDYTPSDIRPLDYRCHPTIRGEIAV